MGLDDLDGMDIPDNKGGRPPKKDNDDKRKRKGGGDPFTSNKGGEDWWEHKFNRFMQDHDSADEAIEALGDHIAVSPIEVRRKLTEFDVFETDWDEYLEKYSIYANDSRIPTVSGGSSSSGSSSSSLFETEEEPSSGLEGLINN